MTLGHTPPSEEQVAREFRHAEEMQRQREQIAELNQRIQQLQQTQGTPQFSGTSVQAGNLPLTTQGSIQTSETVAVVDTVKLPPFWRNNPELWFFQVEAQFTTRRITADNSKYSHVVSGLDVEPLKQVLDIIKNPPAQDKYIFLKEKLIRLTDSVEKQLHKLLTGLELGTKKPSELLREMKLLAAECVTDEMMRSLWMNHMPITLRSILSATDSLDLEQLAELGDKIHDISSPATVMSTHRTSHSSPTIENQLQSLSDRFEKLMQGFSELSDKVNKGNNTRNRSRSAHRSRESDSPNSMSSNGPMCFYHWRYGDKAKRCTKPCTIGTTTPTSGN